MTTPLLQMQGIVKQFPGVRALDGVDLDVVEGEVHCLLGQNGAGKSTMIKVLSGAYHHDSGTITWKGEDVTIDSPVKALEQDRKSTRLNSSHVAISYAVFCLKKTKHPYRTIGLHS